ncbi:TRAP transporter permease [Desulforamulus hydrothermalis]|uniref:TRAP transporter, 4TM/12TM fusion protein n=1 Tax=Desulforamulus hydrothermalis Lam5 = DSM 18033 TaxID=1121428 RepID=K8DZH9_9FIRM|nr:TRAP transporter permease [Desulforamulus hydrothermalis]CCO08375.1 TRAP transporter, 4TM/12TM fusion protein [Desulforamulus hydrothermalis Lam5 = DSM 18033]SHH14166.1 TRAP transporter, 4TM/12TM fusion protein [Desulforamulus hydrothermalis Lam5 = DSM 18033]
MTEHNHQPQDRLNIDRFMAKYDRESDFRRMSGWAGIAVAVIAVAFSLFQLYTAIFGVLDAQIQRAVHLSFGLALVYLLYPARKSWPRHRLHWFDGLLALLAVAGPLYIIIYYQEIIMRAGIVTPADMLLGGLGILMVMEAARRVVGWPIVIVATLFLGYAFAGPYLPGAFAHQGTNLSGLVGHLFFTTEGVFGIPLGVSSTFIFLFILFGAYLEKTGLGKFFIDLANAVAGWARGGPAKVAVLSSGLMGTVSGSSVGNVAGTGSLTIPMMKKLGYRPEFAGAVEAAASTGGQLMPPIMGAAAFLMAEMVGTPYVNIVKAAAIPALLYFTGIWIGVHLEAKKAGLQGIPRDQLPRIGSILLERGHLALPLLAIVYLLVSGRSPMNAALWAIALAIGASLLRRSTRISWRDVLKGLEEGARSALGVVIACATAGIIIGVVTKTGLGLKLGSALIDLAGGRLLPTLFFTMITSIILGMGVPTTANYVITSTIAAPTLIQLGVPVLAAHMFVFYFGIIADVTPPVALAAFAGSGIARSNPMKTGVEASKLAVAAFLIPYIFVLSPSLLLINTTLPKVLLMITTSLLGMTAIAAALSGYLAAPARPLERLVFFGGGLLMIDPNLLTDLVGLGLLVLAYLLNLRQRARQA